jgi:hypothetical protein
MGRKTVAEIINRIAEFQTANWSAEDSHFWFPSEGRIRWAQRRGSLIVSERFRGKDFFGRLRGLWLEWDLDVPVDFFPCTPEEFEKSKKEVSLISEAVKEGIEV